MPQIPDHYIGPDVEPDRNDPALNERVDEAIDLAKRRYFTAGDREDVVTLREAVQELAVLIDTLVPAGRNKALALTGLEDVQMRANRGLFAPEDLR